MSIIKRWTRFDDFSKVVKSAKAAKYCCLICIVIFIAVTLVCSCKKNSQTSASSFKTYTLNYYPTPLTNSPDVKFLRLASGNFIGVLNGGNNDSNFYFYKFDSRGNFISSTHHNFYQKTCYTISAIGNDFFITGTTNITPVGYFAAKFDTNINMLWDTSYKYTNTISGMAACASTDGNILISVAVTTVNSQMYLIKLEAAHGGLLLKEEIKTSGKFICQPSNMQERNNSVYITGIYYYFPSGSTSSLFGSYFCVNASENGFVKWFKNEPVPDSTAKSPTIAGFIIADDTTGPIATIGITCPSTVNFGYIIGAMKAYSFDPVSGNALDSATFGIDSNVELCFIRATQDGGYIIAGTGNYYKNAPTEPTTILLIKTDAHFNVQWQKKINPGGSFYIDYGVFVLSDGYEITGRNSTIVNTVTKEDLFFMKTDLQGNMTD